MIDFKTLGWREVLQRSRDRRVQSQSFADNTMEAVQVLKFLDQDIIRGASVQSYFLTQARDMLRITSKLVKYVG